MSGVVEFWPQEFWSEFKFCNLRSNYDAVWFDFRVSSFKVCFLSSQYGYWRVERSQMLKLLCIYRNGFQHLHMLLGCLRRIMLGLAVCKCTGPACVNVGKPLRSRLSFIVKYLIWSDQMCFSAGWKFALNPLFLWYQFFILLFSSSKNVFTAVFSIVHLLFPHCLLKSKQCVNVSSPRDPLLLSLQYWWEEKVLGPFPATSFFPPSRKTKQLYVCGSGHVSVVDFLLCRWVVELCFPRVLLNSSTTCTECKLALTLTNLLYLLLSHSLCDGVVSVASLALTGREAWGMFWPCVLSHLLLGLHFPRIQGGCTNHCLKPPWLLFSLPNMYEVGLWETHTDIVLCFC